MKKLVIAILLLHVSSVRLSAQTPFATMDSLDINNIHATVLVHGDMWWDPYSLSGPFGTRNYYKCNLYGSGKNINSAGAIWMTGYDAGNNLHVAAQTYRQEGNDYWPGPLETTAPISYTLSQDWAKIWKVSASDVAFYKAQPVHSLSNTPHPYYHGPVKEVCTPKAMQVLRLL